MFLTNIKISNYTFIWIKKRYLTLKLFNFNYSLFEIFPILLCICVFVCGARARALYLKTKNGIYSKIA